MGGLVKILIYVFFFAVVIPSLFNCAVAYNTNVIQGDMPFRDFAAQIVEFSYEPVQEFYGQQIEKFAPKK